MASAAGRGVARAGGRRRLAAAAAAAALLAGCSGVPTDGRVVPVDRVGSGEVGLPDDRIPVLRVPKGPHKGDPPEVIVQGFVQAQASFDGDHAVARSFLALDTRWDAGGDALLFDRRNIGPHELVGNRAVVPLRIRRTGTIDTETGEYRAAAPTSVTLRFVLAAVNGEWRIVESPTGLLVGESDVLQAFRRVTLYFPAAERRRLVPQPVFLPHASGVPVVATVLRALLAGPTEWLAPAVRTAIPPGTQVIGEPEIDDGVLTVDLSREVGRVSGETLQLLAAQLIWTATEGGLGVSGVRLLIEGEAPALPGRRLRRVQDRTDWSAYAPEPPAGDLRLFLLRAGRLFAVEGDGDAVPLRGGSGPYQSYAVSRTGQQFAGVRRAAGGLRLEVGRLADGPMRDAGVAAERFTEPTWRPDGDAVWTVAQGGGPPRVLAVPPEGGAATAVRAPGVTGLVHALRLSPDGSRAVLVVGSGAGRALWQARVQPQPDGVVALDGMRKLAPAVTDVASVSWESAARLVFVGRFRGRAGVFHVDVDGYSVRRISDAGLPRLPEAVTGGRGTAGAPIVAELAGRLWRRERASFWQPLVEGRRPAYAG